MGYKAGKGLGREDDGITKPIEDSSHKGRRGLGFSLEGLEKDEVDWKPEEVNPGFVHPFRSRYINYDYFNNNGLVFCHCMYID